MALFKAEQGEGQADGMPARAFESGIAVYGHARFAVSGGQKIAMVLVIDEVERREPTLLRAHDVAHAAQFVVGFGDQEAVIGTTKEIKPFLSRFAERWAP